MISLRKLIEQLVTEELGCLNEDLQQRQAFADDLIAMGLGEREHTHDAKDDPDFKKDYNKWRYKRLTDLGRPIKQLFNKHADRQWLNQLVTIHGFSNSGQLTDLLQMSSRDELSCTAFLPGNLPERPYRVFSLVVDGHITLLANRQDDVYSYSGKGYSKHLPDRTRDSGANKGLKSRYDAQQYVDDPIFAFDEDDWQDDITNEALVDNWKPVAVVVVYPNDKREVETIIKNFGIDIPVLMWDEARRKL